MFQEKDWEKVCLPAVEWNDLWELFHENSKLSPYGEYLRDDEVAGSMQATYDVLPYAGLPEVALQDDVEPPARGLLDVLKSRTSSDTSLSGPLSLGQLSTILQYSYGVTRKNEDSAYPVPFRVVPSGGALYPLDLFVLARRVDELQSGLFHFDPRRRCLTRLGGPGRFDAIAHSFVQRDISEQAAALVLVGASFRRSTFKYGPRGYRFALIEAGHVAQNTCVVSAAFGLESRCLGGYMDRELDRALDFDGINQSIVYAIALGAPASR